MAGRRAISSPIFYSALLACGLIGLYYGVELVVPRIGGWLVQWKLQRELRSSDPRTRLEAVLATERMDSSLTRAALIEATRDPNVEVRIAACRVLASRSDPPPVLVPALSSAANDASEKVRTDVAQILGRIAAGSTVRSQAYKPQTEAKAVLCRLLHDPKSEVRAAAAEALGEDGPGPAPASWCPRRMMPIVACVWLWRNRSCAERSGRSDRGPTSLHTDR